MKEKTRAARIKRTTERRFSESGVEQWRYLATLIVADKVIQCAVWASSDVMAVSRLQKKIGRIHGATSHWAIVANHSAKGHTTASGHKTTTRAEDNRFVVERRKDGRRQTTIERWNDDEVRRADLHRVFGTRDGRKHDTEQ